MAIREVSGGVSGGALGAHPTRARLVDRDLMRVESRRSGLGDLGDGLLITLDGLDDGLQDITDQPYLPAVPGRHIRPRR